MKPYNAHDRSRNVFMSRRKKIRALKTAVLFDDKMHLCGYYYQDSRYNGRTRRTEKIDKPYVKRVYYQSGYLKNRSNRRVRHSKSCYAVYNNGSYKKCFDYQWAIS